MQFLRTAIAFMLSQYFSVEKMLNQAGSILSGVWDSFIYEHLYTWKIAVKENRIGEVGSGNIEQGSDVQQGPN